MTARYVVRKADGIDGPPIPDDEPCVVIRGQDFLAIGMLATYIGMYKAGPGPKDSRVIEELEAHFERLLDWQDANPDKVKWADR